MDGTPSACEGAREMRNAALARYFRWPFAIDSVWLAAPICVLVWGALLTPLRPFDYFWALTQGRLIAASGEIPRHNGYLFTLPAHAPFFDQPWLAQLAMYGAFRLAGHFANVMVLAVMLAVSVGLLFDCALRLGARPLAVALLGLVSVPFVGLAASARTQMFAYVCFAALLRELCLKPVTSRSWLRAACVACLWANLHGTFVLVLPMLAASVIAHAWDEMLGERTVGKRALWQVLGEQLLPSLAVVLATWVTPRGPLAYAYVVRLGSAMQVGSSSDVSEWQPLSLREPLGLAAALLVLVASVGLLRAHARAPRAALLLNVGLAALTFKSQRFVSWWALSSIVAVSPILPIPARAAEAAHAPRANALLLAGLLLVTLACLPAAPLYERLSAARRALAVPAFSREVPVQSVERLRAAGAVDGIFHEQAVGGYLEWVLSPAHPRQVAFVDQRFELTPASLWREYFAVMEAAPGYRDVLARHSIQTLLIDQVKSPRLVLALRDDPEFRLVGRELDYLTYARGSALRALTPAANGASWSR